MKASIAIHSGLLLLLLGASWKVSQTEDEERTSIEGITHSICTLEFAAHRPLYDWILESLPLPRPLPKQYEFARLNLNHTVMSKRKLLQLEDQGRQILKLRPLAKAYTQRSPGPAG